MQIQQKQEDTAKNHRYTKKLTQTDKDMQIQQKITDTTKTSRYTKNMQIHKKHADTQKS